VISNWHGIKMTPGEYFNQTVLRYNKTKTAVLSSILAVNEFKSYNEQLLAFKPKFPLPVPAKTRTIYIDNHQETVNASTHLGPIPYTGYFSFAKNIDNAPVDVAIVLPDTPFLLASAYGLYKTKNGDNEVQYDRASRPIRVEYNEVVDIVLSQYFFNGVSAGLVHPWHLHGFTAFILGSGLFLFFFIIIIIFISNKMNNIL
jgi:hypothetical protein